MIATSRRMKLTTDSGLLLHDVQFATADDLNDVERRRLFGINPVAPDIAFCHCGWTHLAKDVMAAAVDHVQRDASLPVHAVGGHTLIGSRSRNADSYGSTVCDRTGVAAFAVADGIGSRPAAANAAAVAVITALSAALAAAENRAVSGMLAARDALDLHDLVDDGDTVMVLAVSRPPAPGRGTTWDVVWVGDCQGWLLEDDLLTPVTTPHTHGQRMRGRGIPEHLAARYDNIVLTTVGTADPATLGTTTITTETGRLALTSDGVGKTLEREDLFDTLSDIKNPQRCAQHLAELGASSPRADNATALVIDTHR
jgi:serine/threonine protein phosphatase PrpC